MATENSISLFCSCTCWNEVYCFQLLCGESCGDLLLFFHLNRFNSVSIGQLPSNYSYLYLFTRNLVWIKIDLTILFSDVTIFQSFNFLINLLILLLLLLFSFRPNLRPMNGGGLESSNLTNLTAIFHKIYFVHMFSLGEFQHFSRQ